jgi:predicted nucleic acid-binding protein
MVIVDTTVWIDYLGGTATPQADWLEREMDRQRLGLTDIILCEVLQGIRDDRRFVHVRDQLLSLEVFATGGVALAVATARNYRVLRARGWTVRTTIDGLIATFCLLNGHALLHNDRDFDRFEEALDLRVVHP